MEIDIKRTVYKVQIRRFITLIAFMIVIISVILLNDRRNTLLGLNKYNWGLVIGVFYVIQAVFESFLEYNYIYFTDQGNSIIIKYFSMSFFNKKKQYVEIPKAEFKGYNTEISMFKLKHKVILKRLFKDKEVKYPPINISALSKLEMKNFYDSLDGVV